jgi:lipopolysaccharide biosynthesis protein
MHFMTKLTRCFVRMINQRPFSLRREQEPHYVHRTIEQDYSLAVPLAYTPRSLPQPSSLAVICHMFYPELIAEIRNYLGNIPLAADLFFSTDTEEKRSLIDLGFADWSKGRVETRVMENRGRDVAPRMIGFREVHNSYEYVLHVHSKASRHNNGLATWREFLFKNLVGSPEIVYSVFEAFARHPRLGLVFPQHYEILREHKWISWGNNYPIAQSLAQRMGITVAPERTIDFPSGSMFWARSAALRPLLNLALSFSDFPQETGQIDGTLAHAIERLYLLACERAGFSWLKIANPALYGNTASIVEIDSAAALDRFVAERASDGELARDVFSHVCRDDVVIIRRPMGRR